MTDFGTDLSWTDDVDPAHAMVSGTLLVAQAIYRRLITPRGRLIGEPDYGFDIRGILSKGLTQKEVAKVQVEIRHECLKDERVASVDVTLTQSGTLGSTWNIDIAGTTAAGPFKLVLAVADAAAIILEAA